MHSTIYWCAFGLQNGADKGQLLEDHIERVSAFRIRDFVSDARCVGVEVLGGNIYELGLVFLPLAVLRGHHRTHHHATPSGVFTPIQHHQQVHDQQQIPVRIRCASRGTGAVADDHESIRYGLPL